jgi:MoxR-like ATPase
MKTIEVIDLTKICQNFPSMPSPDINRDNYLETIDKIFLDGVPIIVLEGEEGIGKTTLMGKFALRHPLNSSCWKM